MGYKGDRKVITSLDKRNKQHSYAMGCARDRHETINARMKTWGVSKLLFRYNKYDHHFFEVLQVKIESGSKPFEVINYIDPVCI